MSWLVLGSVLIACPVYAQEPTLQERVAGVLPEGVELPPAPETPTAVPAPAPVAPVVAPVPVEVTVDLKELLNKHWVTTDSFGQGQDKVFISGQLNMSRKNPYLVVSVRSDPAPKFIKLERGMAGRFTANNATYNVKLDVSMFRKPMNNYIVIEKSDSGKMYRPRISELFEASYLAGKEISVGGRTYRLFYFNAIDTSQSPAVIDREKFAFGLIYEAKGGKDRDFRLFFVPRQDIVGKFVAFKDNEDKVFGGMTLKFRVSEDFSTLEITR